MRSRSTVVVAALLALATACGAFAAAEAQRVRLVGVRMAVANSQWRATLQVRPASSATPRVTARSGRATVNVRARRTAAGRYALTATFPQPGRWQLAVRVGSARHTLGVVGVSAAQIRLRSVLGLALHPDGGLLIADSDARRIVRADLSSGRLTTFASGPLFGPTGITVAPDGTVYAADRHARAIFRIVNGAVSRVADYGDPLDVAVDSQGTIFTTGRESTVVRVDPATRAVTRYAGTGEAGSSGNGGPALAARVDSPHGIEVDPSGNAVLAEVTMVRRIDRATNVIDTIAGNGTRVLCGEQGPAREVCLTALRVAFEPDGDFYVADPENRRLWRVSGGQARVYSLAFSPFDVLVESEGKVLIADNENARVLRFDAGTDTLATVVESAR